MSYANKYIIEFNSIHNVAWKIDIQEDGWTGDVITLKATGDPLHFEFDSDSDAYNEPIRPSKAIMNVFSESDFALIDFYSDQDFRLKVNIYKDAYLFWIGFIVTGEYEEPYDQPPYPVKLIAIDGLNYLKQTPYASSVSVTGGVETITYYEGRQLESKIVCDILAKIGWTGFREYVNIYDVAMASTVDDSPFDQTLIDVDVFRDKDCWDVLTEILKKYNAVIRQSISGSSASEMVIYRPSELVNTTVYGRRFTAWDTKTSTSYEPAQYINRTALSSDLHQFPGSALMTKRPARKLTINQDYGYKKSVIDNWEMKGNTITKVNSVTYLLQGWTKSHTWGIQPATVLGEADGVLMSLPAVAVGSPGVGDPFYDHYISQQFGTYLQATANMFFIEFDFMFYNDSGTPRTGCEIHVEVSDIACTNYLYAFSDAVCAWDNSPASMDPTGDAPLGSSGWTTFKRQVPGLPADGPYLIRLYAQLDTYAGVYLVFKNIRFYSTSDAIVTRTMKPPKPKGEIFFIGKRQLVHYLDFQDNPEVVTKQYVLENKIGGVVIKGVEYGDDYLLGDVIDSDTDNIIEQFQGALAVNNTPPVPTTSWNAGGSSAPLLEVITGETGAQMSRPKQLIQMNIQEYHDISGTLGMTVDSILTVDSGITIDTL